uniref:C-X-C chemokine receptor type 5-like n=1 Tax=Saccoglossus kowalevskii TaxID=10224 RepID=A0ABM0MQB9_SACKO|nr:PREDICTED: c-X-C chemokine receptor type 5-like [Saccoglossus kowalevskii]
MALVMLDMDIMNKSIINDTVYVNDTLPENDVLFLHNTTFEMAFLSVIAILGLFGNILVLVVYCQKKYSTSNASLYMQHLAWGDLLAVIVVAFIITESYPSTWHILWRADIQCIIQRTLRFVGFHNTLGITLAIAIDRYYAICHALHYRARLTIFRTKIAILCVWIASVLTALPFGWSFRTQYGGLDNIKTEKSSYACSHIIMSEPYYCAFPDIRQATATNIRGTKAKQSPESKQRDLRHHAECTNGATTSSGIICQVSTTCKKSDNEECTICTKLSEMKAYSTKCSELAEKIDILMMSPYFKQGNVDENVLPSRLVGNCNTSFQPEDVV